MRFVYKVRTWLPFINTPGTPGADGMGGIGKHDIDTVTKTNPGASCKHEVIRSRLRASAEVA